MSASPPRFRANPSPEERLPTSPQAPARKRPIGHKTGRAQSDRNARKGAGSPGRRHVPGEDGPGPLRLRKLLPVLEHSLSWRWEGEE